MRILMTTDTVGGVWSYTAELCKALATHVTRIDLACFGRIDDARRHDFEECPHVHLHESGFRLEWMRGDGGGDQLWEEVGRGANWVRRLAAEANADLVHANSYGPALVDLDLPLLVVTHSCVHTWWHGVHGNDPDPEWDRYRSCVLRALCTAASVVAPTSAQLAQVSDCYEEVNLNGRARVIQNGIDLSRWAVPRQPGGKFVLAVGRVWDEAKNLRRLVAAAPDLPCPVFIAGDGELRPRRRNAGIVMLGALPRRELLPWYSRAAAFAHPARYEPFGLAVLEAALAGCPLVLGDIPSLRELWHRAACFVDPDDSEAWRATLDRVVSDPVENRRLGRAARERALGYGATRMAAAYADEYRRLIGLRREEVA